MLSIQKLRRRDLICTHSCGSPRPACRQTLLFSLCVRSLHQMGSLSRLLLYTMICDTLVDRCITICTCYIQYCPTKCPTSTCKKIITIIIIIIIIIKTTEKIKMDIKIKAKTPCKRPPTPKRKESACILTCPLIGNVPGRFLYMTCKYRTISGKEPSK